MKLQQFLEHHGLASNPFSEEDAQTDPVFKQHCIGDAYHPAWDKIYGNPEDPSTSIVFGEKGAGKTAIRLQIVRHLEQHNKENSRRRVFVIQYDDFNRFLDRFRDRLSPRNRNPDRLLGAWKLWDHMDSILCLGVTQLVDQILGEVPADAGPSPDVKSLGHHEARDLLLLAACYDESPAESFSNRWTRLRRKLKYRVWLSYWPLVLGIVATVVILTLFGTIGGWKQLLTPWPYLLVAVSWLPWLWQAWGSFWLSRGIMRQVHVVNRDRSPLRRVLARFRRDAIAGQPLPNKERTDDRYELLSKFQGVLRSLGYSGIVVLVDRVDEPHLINGAADRMRALLWPMLDNKFLKNPGIGYKLLLPIELLHFINREDRDFYERARLDKQNLVRSLEWSGEALYDVAEARIKACSNGQPPNLHDFFEESVSDRRLIDALRSLRVPRHMFKFLHRLFVAHCNAYTDRTPQWKISGETFESTLALYQRDQDAFDRGMGAG